MVRYSKRSYRKRPLRYRYRRYPSSRRKYSRKKYFRRRRASKIEYKRHEKTLERTFSLSYGTVYEESNINSATAEALIGGNNCCFVIGGATNLPFQSSINQGPGISQRIGAKINPIKLRIYGTISLVNPSMIKVMETPCTVYARCVVFQVRGGNTTLGPAAENFTSVNPVFDTDTGDMIAVSGRRLFSEFYGGEAYTADMTVPNNPIFSLHPVIIVNDLNKYQTLTKVPFRNGIGGALRILKNKLYKMNLQYNSSFSFRFKTKKPNRLVWPESPNDPNANTTVCRNPIYICWWIIPTTSLSYKIYVNPDIDPPRQTMPKGAGDIRLSYGVQMYYTDS